MKCDNHKRYWVSFALIETCNVIRIKYVIEREGGWEGEKGREGEREGANLSRKVPHADLTLVSLVFRYIRGFIPVFTGRIFSIPLRPVSRVPFSLSHFPVGCYCRVSSPTLIKSFVLRRRRRSVAFTIRVMQLKISAEYFENKRRLVFSSCANSRRHQIHVKLV